MDWHKISVAQDLGLTRNDVDAISAAQSMIPWPVSYDQGDEGELYAIIHTPRDDWTFAFLLDREGANLVLTDNLTDPLGVVVTTFPDVKAAAAHVSRMLSGT